MAARLLRSWVRIPPGAWIFVCCECRVLSGRGLCDKLITRPEESYRLCCVVVCDLEASRIGAPYIYDSSLRVNIHYSENLSSQNVMLNSSKLKKTSKLRSSNGCFQQMHHLTTMALTLWSPTMVSASTHRATMSRNRLLCAYNWLMSQSL